MRLVRGGCAVQIALSCLALPCPHLAWRAQQQCSADRRTCFNNKLLSSVGEGWAAAIGREGEMERQGRPSPRHRQGVVDPLDECKSHQGRTEKGREKKTED